MILPVEIQQFEEIAPKKEGDTPLFRFVCVDKSLPSAARCSTPFEVFMGTENRNKMPKGDLTDTKCNLLVREMKQGRVGIQCKGELMLSVPASSKG